MSNKSVKQKRSRNFDNLKFLSGVVSGKDIAEVFANIKNAKDQINAFCKNIKARETAVLKAEQQAEVKAKQQTAEKESFAPKQNKSVGKRTSSHSEKPYSQKRASTAAAPSRQTGQQRPQQPSQRIKRDDGFQRGARPAQPTAPKVDKFGKPDNIVSFTNTKHSGQTRGRAKHRNTTEKRGLNIREKMRMGHAGFDETKIDGGTGYVKYRNRRQRSKRVVEKPKITHAVITEEVLTVRMFSEKIGQPVSEIIKKLLLLGLMYNINSVIDYPTAELIAAEFDVTLEQKVEKSFEEKLADMFDVASKKASDDDEIIKRPPVVTVMGHVDHGKTSLLDYIKKSHVIQGEAGGITQHIGAYSINVKDEKITFIDTPGHEAFSNMRERGATVGDIAVLIIAADDGVMPQTKEAAKHIKDAGIPMIVAINKIDKVSANVEKVKQQLTEIDVLIEDWGGDTIYVPISSHTGEGVDKLLEMILLVADVHEFKANKSSIAQATCIESKVETGKGIVANIIVKDGTLRVGDYVVCGLASGRVRAMTDYLGKSLTEAGPSMAVSLIGLNAVPDAGEILYVVDERLARNIIEERSHKLQIEKTKSTSGITLEAFMGQKADEQKKVYKVIIKADVQGTSEALKTQLESLENEEVVVSCISQGVGVVNENDVTMAKASGAQIIAFNTKIDAKARLIADRESVEIQSFKIIYDASNFVEKAISKMITPKFKENEVGKAEVRKVFKISSLGSIAGSYVTEGKIPRNSVVKVFRNDKMIAETTIDNLQQEKDQVREVRSGFECGIKLKGFNDVKVGDIITAYESVRIN